MHSPTQTPSQPSLILPYFLRPLPLPNPLSDELSSQGPLPLPNPLSDELSSQGPLSVERSSHGPKPDELPSHGTSTVELPSHGPKPDELTSHGPRVDAAILNRDPFLIRPFSYDDTVLFYETVHATALETFISEHLSQFL